MRTARTVASAATILVGVTCLTAWIFSGVLIAVATDKDAFSALAATFVNDPEVTQLITTRAQANVEEDFRQQGVDLNLTGLAVLVETAITDAVESDDFEALVTAQVESGYEQFVAALTDSDRAPDRLVLTFDISAIVNQRLGEQGVLGALVLNTAVAPVQVEVVDAERFETARAGFEWLERARTWGLWCAVALACIGMFVSPRRRWFPTKFSLALGAQCMVVWGAIQWRGASIVSSWFDNQEDAFGSALGDVVTFRIVDAASDQLWWGGIIALIAAAGSAATVLAIQPARPPKHSKSVD